MVTMVADIVAKKTATFHDFILRKVAVLQFGYLL